MKLSLHTRALLQALLVTFLWSTSFVLIKIGLADLPALIFAGLRYALAFLCLLPFAARSPSRAALRQLPRRAWIELLALGLIYYAVTHGAIYLALADLPATAISLLLNFTTILVALLGILFLSERPTIWQWGGTFLFLAGAILFFYPIDLLADRRIGWVFAVISVVANALSSILGRSVNRESKLDPMLVTVVSIGVGGGALLTGGLALHGLPSLQPIHWLVIVWLAVVNSAVAFTLWNRALQTLAAVESSIINNTMLIQIAILAWLFLGEELTALKILGLLAATVGTLIAQMRLTKRRGDCRMNAQREKR